MPGTDFRASRIGEVGGGPARGHGAAGAGTEPDERRDDRRPNDGAATAKPRRGGEVKTFRARGDENDLRLPILADELRLRQARAHVDAGADFPGAFFQQAFDEFRAAADDRGAILRLALQHAVERPHEERRVLETGFPAPDSQQLVLFGLCLHRKIIQYFTHERHILQKRYRTPFSLRGLIITNQSNVAIK